MRTQNGNTPQLYFNLIIAINEYESSSSANGGDQRMLYEWLQTDTSIMAKYPLLDSFYQAQFVRETEKLVQVERLVGLLCDSTLRSTPASWHTTLTQAYSTNNSIISDEYFVNNEKWVNDMYLNYLENGLSSIDDDDQDALQTLAFSCPYIGGPSVYKARNLYAIYEPGLYYDDLRICNNAGVYKNGKGLFDEEDLLINSVSKSAINKFNKDEFVIYPNPAETQLSIKYTLTNQQNAQFILCDILGRGVKKVELPYTSNIVTLLVNDLIPGVYTYKQICNGVQTRTGKVVIEK